MKIQILEQENNKIHFLIEREEGIYNNVNVTSEFTDEEIIGLSEDEIKTLAYYKVKPIAIRVFEQIEPLDEVDSPSDFELIPSRPIRLEILGSSVLQIGQTEHYQVMAYDQYNKVMEASPVVENTIIEATAIGQITVRATLESLTSELLVNVIERIKSKEEILELEVADIWYDNMLKDVKIQEQDTEIANLWYEIMTVGVI